MPTDPQTIAYDNTELLLVLAEVEKIMDTAEYDDVAWIGDLNWDKTRNSGFAHTIDNFVSRLGLSNVWDKYPVDYTHIHTDYRSTSTLDRILVNERLLEYIVDAGGMHFGDNPSRHSPIMMKLDVGNIPVITQSKEKVLRRPAWYKAEQEQIDEYTDTLDFKLRWIDIPESLCCENPNCKDEIHNKEKDKYMLDILSAMIETSHKVIPLSGGGG